ncbi:FecCD family ABC transporter permease [Mangrovicoccus algicola]|uniref:Iron ABC transporter permease n=1 Tax=Mangrovicoccus algicola TaxID=2771008 RepID=A0A8J6Z6G0_9RHOB|nr:iron ABC transporter permease [Mangrovicoccus algicola]MBE3637295.1 iron ABC transporter permease [Mangrovicoccus algicola]
MSLAAAMRRLPAGGLSLGLAPVLGAAAAILAVALAAALMLGDVRVGAADVAATLGNRLLGLSLPVDPIREGIIWHYRASRAVVAMACGAALAVCGVVLQALLRNPLAEPYLLGISAGASAGAVSVIVLAAGAGLLGVPAGALAGAALAFALVGLLAFGAGGGTERIILAGVAGSQLFNAATAFIVASSADAEQTRGILFWMLGSLGGVRWPDAALAVPVALAGLGLCLWRARALDAFAFGEDAAAALGVEVVRLRAGLLALTAVLTAAVVSLIGAVGFVGLVIPHAMRFLVGPSHGRLIPAAALAGAVFLTGADVLSRLVLPGQVLPVGVVTALFGAPAFALILWRSRGRR